MFLEVVGIVFAINPDDQPEPAAAAGFHTGQGILHNHRPAGVDLHVPRPSRFGLSGPAVDVSPLIFGRFPHAWCGGMDDGESEK